MTSRNLEKQSCEGGIRRAKAHLQWNLARDMKTNKKVFHKYISRRRKTGANS